MMSAQHEIVLDGVEKRFAGMDQPAVASLSTRIASGAVMGLVGPDGAGKTTLIRMLAGLLKPSAGTVSVVGLDPLTQDSELHAILGYMPQKFGLYEDLTVIENLTLYADLRGVIGEERRKTFDRLLKFTDLTRFTERLAGKLSGGIANTFLAAAGHPVGKSLYEPDLLDTARAIAAKVNVPLPVDVVVAKEFAETAAATVKWVADVAEDDMILDIGPQTAANFAELLKSSKTILWNGPVGVFEFDQFGNGTKVLAQAIADSSAFSIAGGGDTLAAIDKYGVADQISYISTGGGAFLEFVEGKVLPAVEVLESRAKG